MHANYFSITLILKCFGFALHLKQSDTIVTRVTSCNFVLHVRSYDNKQIFLSRGISRAISFFNHHALRNVIIYCHVSNPKYCRRCIWFKKGLKPMKAFEHYYFSVRMLNCTIRTLNQVFDTFRTPYMSVDPVSGMSGVLS